MNAHPHLTPRQRAREVAFQFLYQFLTADQKMGSPAEVEKEFQKHMKHFQTPDTTTEFAERLVRTTATCIRDIDSMISKHAENWRLDRLGAIERAFLRMGTAELLYFKDVPASVTLNEIVELSKLFGEAETPAFLNGILDPISREPSALQGKVASE